YALRGQSRLTDGPTPLGATSWLAVLAGGVFLGVSATVYTLFTAVFAGSAVLIALVYLAQAWLLPRNAAVRGEALKAQRRPAMLAVVVRLAVMGVLACLIALIVWGPYLLERFRTDA